jgi:GT2 family glycosyltransferase
VPDASVPDTEGVDTDPSPERDGGLNEEPAIDAPAPAGVAIYNSNPGEVTNAYSEWIYQIIIHNLGLGEANALAGVRQQPSGACISVTRDAGMLSFLNDTNAEWVLWLDSDISGEPHIIQQMLEVADPVNAPIVCGLYVTILDDAGIAPCAWVFDDTIPFGTSPLVPLDPKITAKQKSDGVRLVEVGATGAGCLLIHRSAVVAMHRHYGAFWFQEDVIRGVRMGEDFSFAFKARGIGYKIFCDLGVNTVHKKPILLTPDHLETLEIRKDTTEGSPT